MTVGQKSYMVSSNSTDNSIKSVVYNCSFSAE